MNLQIFITLAESKHSLWQSC